MADVPFRYTYCKICTRYVFNNSPSKNILIFLTSLCQSQRHPLKSFMQCIWLSLFFLSICIYIAFWVNFIIKSFWHFIRDILQFETWDMFFFHYFIIKQNGNEGTNNFIINREKDALITFDSFCKILYY